MAPRLLSLAGFLPAWDLEKRSVNIQPIVEWMLARLRVLGHSVQTLDDVRLRLTSKEARDTNRALSAASLERDARRRICCVVREAIPELLDQPVLLQTRAHFRILLPDDPVSPVPPHTDFGFGHSLYERNLWFSLTRASGHAALHALDLKRSLRWMSQTNHLHGVLDQAPEPAPIATDAGDVLLFTPLHVHRAHQPDAHQFRISFDIRIIPAHAAPADLTFSPMEFAQ